MAVILSRYLYLACCWWLPGEDQQMRAPPFREVAATSEAGHEVTPFSLSSPPNVLIYKLAFAGACITLLPAMLVTDDLLPAGVYQPPSHKYSEQAAKTTVPATKSAMSVTGAHTTAAQQQPKRLYGEPHHARFSVPASIFARSAGCVMLNLYLRCRCARRRLQGQGQRQG